MPPATLHGQIRQVQTNLSASEDRVGRLQVGFNVTGQEDTVDALTRLMQPGRGCYVVVFDEVEYERLNDKKP
jgi:catabolite regulation protein CreA